jgi:hypothetical protein
VGEPPGAVRLLAADGLAVAVSEVDPEAQLGGRDLRRHMDVVDRLFKAGQILPFRFGVVVDDEESLISQVGARREMFEADLLRLAGHTEFELSVRFNESDALAALLRDQPSLRHLSEASRGSTALAQRVELGQAVYQQLEAWKEAQAAAVLAKLQHQVVGMTTRTPLADTVLRAAFLVSQEQRGSFESTVQRLAQDMTWLRFESVGPMPTYSFVEAA